MAVQESDVESLGRLYLLSFAGGTILDVGGMRDMLKSREGDEQER